MKPTSAQPSLTGNNPALVALKEFDWRRLQRLTDPQMMKDLDEFLDNLPQRAGKNAIIVAAVIWVIAAIGLFLLFNNTLSLRAIQKQLAIAEGTQIAVPQISYETVSPPILAPTLEKLRKIYPTLTFDIQSSGAIGVNAVNTRDFPAWRSAINDLAYGSPGWKISVQKLCAGRNCKDQQLQASILVQDVNIHLPPAEDAAEAEPSTP